MESKYTDGGIKYEHLRFSISSADDLPVLENIRMQAFTPIFNSFRSILGDQIYEWAQRAEDENQAKMLTDLVAKNEAWLCYTVLIEDTIVGFISYQSNSKSKVGEIGLNAVDPKFAGKGIGTHMYTFALSQMKKDGMKVATVATGGDPSHLPARKAYKNVGFNVEIPSVWMCKILDED